MRLSDPVHLDRSTDADPGSKPAAFEAEVTAVDGDTVSIVIPGYDRLRDFTGVSYLGGTPLVGGQVFAAFSDQREPLVLVPGGVGKYAETIGDGAATSYVVTHSLGTRDLTVAVRDMAAPYEAVGVTWQATTDDTVTVIFSSAPATDSRRVTVIG